MLAERDGRWMHRVHNIEPSNSSAIPLGPTTCYSAELE